MQSAMHMPGQRTSCKVGFRAREAGNSAQCARRAAEPGSGIKEWPPWLLPKAWQGWLRRSPHNAGPPACLVCLAQPLPGCAASCGDQMVTK